jgi:hypothetical protein
MGELGLCAASTTIVALISDMCRGEAEARAEMAGIGGDGDPPGGRPEI